MALLSIKNLTCQLLVGGKKLTVINSLNFDLESGKTLALVGESGCGKSMTALSIMGILPRPPALDPTGEILYQKKNLLDLNENEMRKIRGKRIGMIFQDPMSALNPVYTIGDQLMEVAVLHLNMDEEEAEERAIRSLQEVGIPSPEKRIHEYPHQLSGGMKQRVMIAMALMCKPDILIADEPTTSLDVTIQAQVLDLMRHLQEREGMALLLITHDMGVVAEMADDVVVMYASRAVEKGHVNSIFDRMSHPYTQGLFHSIPSRGERGKKLSAIKGSVPSLAYLPAGCPFHPRCPQVMPKCRQGDVPNFKLDEEGHETNCWLYEQQGIPHG